MNKKISVPVRSEEAQVRCSYGEETLGRIVYEQGGQTSWRKDQQHKCQLQQKDPNSHGGRPMGDAAMVSEEVGTKRCHTGTPYTTQPDTLESPLAAEERLVDDER